MISKKILSIIACSLAMSSASYAGNTSSAGDKLEQVACTVGNAYFSGIAFPFKKAGNVVRYSAQTVVDALKALKPASKATIEAAKLALFVGAVLAAVYGAGYVAHNYPSFLGRCDMGWPFNKWMKEPLDCQFYDYASPKVDAAITYGTEQAQALKAAIESSASVETIKAAAQSFYGKATDAICQNQYLYETPWLSDRLCVCQGE